LISSADGTGTLSAGKDMGNAMRAAGVAPTDEEIENLSTGAMSLEQFTAACNSIQTPTSSELNEAFEVFDQTGNGYISIDELTTVMKFLGEGMDDAMLEKMKTAAAPDKEGQVNIRHFVDVLCKGF